MTTNDNFERLAESDSAVAETKSKVNVTPGQAKAEPKVAAKLEHPKAPEHKAAVKPEAAAKPELHKAAARPEQLKAKWKQFLGGAKVKWGKLTDADWTAAEGDAEKLAGKIQEKHGTAKAVARAEIDEMVLALK